MGSFRGLFPHCSQSCGSRGDCRPTPDPSAPARLVWVESERRASWSHWEGRQGRAAGRNRSLLLGSQESASSLSSSVPWLLRQNEGQLLRAGISTAAPKGRSEPPQESRVKRPQPGWVKMPQCRGRRWTSVTVRPAGAERRRRGKRAGPQREAKEGKLNVRAEDQDDRWHQSRSALPGRPPRPTEGSPRKEARRPGEL